MHGDLILDNEWVQVSEQTTNSDNEVVPLYARFIRTSGGSLIARIVRIDRGKRFWLQRLHGGALDDLGKYDSADLAYHAMLNIQAART